MQIKPIKTEADYLAVLARIKELMTAAPETEERDELDVLTVLVERYEENHYPIPKADPLEAILFVMEQNNISKKELGKLINSRSGVSELFNKHRALSLEQIRIFNEKLHIPADILIKKYDLVS